MNYTKGEWLITETVLGETAIVRIGEVGQAHVHICNIPTLTTYAATGGEKKANAKLIAAAPDLLEALKELLRDCNDGDYMPVCPGVTSIDKARQAIEKAIL